MRTKDFYITTVILLVSFLGYSAPPSAPGPTGPPPPVYLPINDNILFLAGAGFLLGCIQLISNTKNKKTQSKT